MRNFITNILNHKRIKVSIIIQKFIKGYWVSKKFEGQKKDLYYTCINKNHDFLMHEEPLI